MAQLCFNTFNRSAFFGVDPDLPAQIDAAGAAGFRLFGPDTFSLDAWVDDGRELSELVGLLDARGMQCWEIAALNLTGRRETLADAQHVAELAAVFRPKWILTNVGVPVDRELCETFSMVCDVLAAVGARPAIEYLPFTPANSLGTARVLVDHVGTARAAILFDTWHHFRGPDTYAELDAAELDLIAYIQFDDARPMITDDLGAETIHRRTFPGDGEFDLAGYCDRITAMGWDGVVSVEILDEAWRDGSAGSLHEFARRAYESSARYWTITEGAA
jgi:sugar phosphate isomerase/epimerase